MKKKIIIAETVQRLVDRDNTLFARGGVTLFPAPSCEEILQLHHAHKADLIIADAILPVMGGAKLCTAIRKDSSLKGVSIIMACESADAGTEEYRSAGSNAVLPKPLDPIGLFSMVSQMLMVHHRLDARIPLCISVEAKDTKSTFVGISKDISVSGMLIESGRILQPGERMECTFTVNSHVLSVTCVVARAQQTPEGKFLYGIKFLNLDAKTFILIEHFVKNSPSPSDIQ